MYEKRPVWSGVRRALALAVAWPLLYTSVDVIIVAGMLVLQVPFGGYTEPWDVVLELVLSASLSTYFGWKAGKWLRRRDADVVVRAVPVVWVFIWIVADALRVAFLYSDPATYLEDGSVIGLIIPIASAIAAWFGSRPRPADRVDRWQGPPEAYAPPSSRTDYYA